MGRIRGYKGGSREREGGVGKGREGETVGGWVEGKEVGRKGGREHYVLCLDNLDTRSTDPWVREKGKGCRRI